MKKVFAIIAIMVVLVGAVFATENELNQTSTITVKTIVDRHLPEFRLDASLAPAAIAATSTATSQDLATDNRDTAFQGEILDATGIDISVDDLTVYFGIYQTNLVNVDEAYELTYDAGKLTWMGETDSPTPAKYVQGDTLPDGKAVGDLKYVINTTITESAISAVEVANTVTGYDKIDVSASNSGEALTVTYTGKVGAASTDLLLGTFNVKWDHDVEAPSGYYRADVVLFVTTV